MKVLTHLKLIKIINLLLLLLFYSCSKKEDTKQIDLTGEWINSDSTSYINIYGERFAFQKTVNSNFHADESVLLFYGKRQDSISDYYYDKLKNYLLYALDGDTILYLYKPNDFIFTNHTNFDIPISKKKLYKYRKIEAAKKKVKKILTIELWKKTYRRRRDSYIQITKDSIMAFNCEENKFLFKALMNKKYFDLLEEKISELNFLDLKDNNYGEAGYKCNIKFEDTTRTLNFLYADYESVDKIDLLDNRSRCIFYIYQAFYRGFHIGNCTIERLENSFASEFYKSIDSADIHSSYY